MPTTCAENIAARARQAKARPLLAVSVLLGMAAPFAAADTIPVELRDRNLQVTTWLVPGMNGGWIQVMGPLSRVPEFRQIETTMFARDLQQRRYPPSRIADSADSARSRLVLLPGASYVDPQFSWRYDVAPAGASFVRGDALGTEYAGTFWIGSARSYAPATPTGGSLYRMRLTPDRLAIDVSADPRLADRVADNLTKFEPTESESLLIGRGFGVTPAIEQGPDGNLYVVSLSDGVVYRISRATTPTATSGGSE